MQPWYEREDTFPLSDGWRALKGIRKSPRTLYDWHETGRKVRRSKERVKLEAYSDGQSLRTSNEAVLRFLRKLNGMQP